MKKFKSLLALLMAFAMTIGLGVTTFAATVTIEGDDLKDHTFYAYKIFAGDEENGILSNIKEGDVPLSELITALQADNTLKNDFPATNTNGDTITYDAQKIADVLVNYEADGEKAQAFAKVVDSVIKTHDSTAGNTAISYTNLSTSLTNGTGTVNLADGYYLIVDKSNYDEDNDGVDDSENEMINASLLQVVGNITIKTKTAKPEVDKQILEDKPGENNTERWQYHGDYEIGQDISFRLTSNLPDISRYDDYTYRFKDDMSDGLTFVDMTSVKVTWTDSGTEKEYEITSTAQELKATVNGVETTFGTIKYTLTMGDESAGEDKDDFTLEISDLKALKNYLVATNATSGVTNATTLRVVVDYTGELNDDAIVGNYGSETAGTQVGNPNTVYLEYSNEPNGDGFGKTEEHTVYAFTFTLDVNKVDAEDNKLGGAKFYLFKESRTELSDTGWDANNTQSRTITHSYAILNEPSTPDDGITDWTITGWSDVTTTYTVTRTGDSTTGYTYTYTDSNGNVVTEDDLHKSTAPSNATELVSSTTEDIVIIGLDGNDVYYLVETAAPSDEYNRLEKPVSFTINPTYDENTKALTQLNMTVDGATFNSGNESTGIAKMDVENKKGNQLPTTGATGTMIFIIIGAALTLGTAILIITRKKMSVYED